MWAGAEPAGERSVDPGWGAERRSPGARADWALKKKSIVLCAQMFVCFMPVHHQKKALDNPPPQLELINDHCFDSSQGPLVEQGSQCSKQLLASVLSLLKEWLSPC